MVFSILMLLQAKPTWANHLNASNTATDIVGFVSDDPYERFEIQSDAALTAIRSWNER